MALYFTSPSEYVKLNFKKKSHITKSIGQKKCIAVCNNFYVDDEHYVWIMPNKDHKLLHHKLLTKLSPEPIIDFLVPLSDTYVAALHVDGTVEIISFERKFKNGEWNYFVKSDDKLDVLPTNIKKLCFSRMLNGVAQGTEHLYCIDIEDSIKIFEICTIYNRCTSLDVFSPDFKVRAVYCHGWSTYIIDILGVVWLTHTTVTTVQAFDLAEDKSTRSVLRNISQSVDPKIAHQQNNLLFTPANVDSIASLYKYDTSVVFGSPVRQLSVAGRKCLLILLENGTMYSINNNGSRLFVSEVFFNIFPHYFIVQYYEDNYKFKHNRHYVLARDEANNIEIIPINKYYRNDPVTIFRPLDIKGNLPQCELLSSQTIVNNRFYATKRAD